MILRLLKKMQKEEQNRALVANIPKKRPPIGFKSGRCG